MKILEKLNLLYRKFLYVLVPILTVLIAVSELFDASSSGLHITVCIIMGFISISFFGFYMMLEKSNVVYCLIELYLFFCMVFLAVANRVDISDSMWHVFISIEVLGLLCILLLKRYYDKIMGQ